MSCNTCQVEKFEGEPLLRATAEDQRNRAPELEWPWDERIDGTWPRPAGRLVRGGRGSQPSPNCLAGPPSDTPCSIQVRQMGSRSAVVTITTPGPAMGGDGDIGLSPYTTEGGGDEVFMVNIPTANLTGVTRICEISVEVISDRDPEDDPFVYSGAAGLVQLRSGYWTERNGAPLETSVATGGKFGRKLLTTDGRCACDCVIAFNTYDLTSQLEFTIPGLTALRLIAEGGDMTITIRMEVERCYLVSDNCSWPEDCAEQRRLEPVAPVFP